MAVKHDGAAGTITFDERGSAAATPSSGQWTLYTTELGLLLVDDAGNVIEIGGTFCGCGGIYAKDASVQQAGIDTTPVKLTAFDADGNEDNVVADHTDDSLEIDTDFDGDYMIWVKLDFELDKANKFTFFIRKNGVETNWGAEEEVSTDNTIGHISIFAIEPGLVATDKLTIYVESDNVGGADITVTQAQFFIKRYAH